MLHSKEIILRIYDYWCYAGCCDYFQGILDITTTEVVDYLVGGVMPCDSSRFEAAIDQKIPVVLTVGALDMVNFGSKDTIPAKFARRKLFVHNDQVSIIQNFIKMCFT
jgi:uncharacterized protein (UPF0261 family)